MDLLAVVLAKLLLLFLRPCPERLGEVALGILAADHESNLARRVGGNGSVCVLDVGEDLLARLLEAGDKGQVKPLILS